MRLEIRRLESRATLDYVMKQLENDYGTLESNESIMKKFYLCEQQSNGTVLAFTTRLGDLYDKAVNLTALRRLDMGLLKELLYSGLKPELNNLSVF